MNLTELEIVMIRGSFLCISGNYKIRSYSMLRRMYSTSFIKKYISSLDSLSDKGILCKVKIGKYNRNLTKKGREIRDTLNSIDRL